MYLFRSAKKKLRKFEIESCFLKLEVIVAIFLKMNANCWGTNILMNIHILIISFKILQALASLVPINCTTWKKNRVWFWIERETKWTVTSTNTRRELFLLVVVFLSSKKKKMDFYFSMRVQQYFSLDFFKVCFWLFLRFIENFNFCVCRERQRSQRVIVETSSAPRGYVYDVKEQQNKRYKYNVLWVNDIFDYFT